MIRKRWMVICMLAIGCSSNTGEKRNAESKDTALTKAMNQTDTSCYIAVQNRDTIWLQLFTKDSTVTGHMQYDNFEMDGNIGTLQGTWRNGWLEGYFHFLSEGMWSLREIIFEQRDSTLVQAQTTDMIYSGDTARFENKTAMAFDEQRVFKKWDCGKMRMDTLPQ